LYAKGIEIVRKDSPEGVKPIITEGITKILKNGTEDEMRSFFIEKFDKFKGLPLIQTGIPKNITKSFDSYKVKSQHLKAAIYSNENLGTHFESTPFGYMYFVKVTEDHPTTDVVLLEEENLSLPDWIEIDLQTQYFKSCVVKFRKFYETLGWDFKKVEEQWGPVKKKKVAVESTVKFTRRTLDNGYVFLNSPGIDGAPKVSADELKEFTKLTVKSFGKDYDLIVTAETMGIPYATALSMKTGIPISVIRKKPLNLKFETKFQRNTGYKADHLYLNLPRDHAYDVLFVDDVLSTGGTARVALNYFRVHLFDIIGVAVYLNKPTYGGQKIVEEEFNLPLRYMYRFDGDKIYRGNLGK
jgi:adenine phosphoribosyltransferase